MREIFVNLKRFDVPRVMGGVCTKNNPKQWIEEIIDQSIGAGLGQLEDSILTYILPESLVITAKERLATYNQVETQTLAIGIQGVYREDIKQGGNFGAFTTHLPAAAAVAMGSTLTLIGHCEERRDKEGIITCYEPNWQNDQEKCSKVATAVNTLINQEVKAAFNQNLKVLFCIGETAKQRGEGTLEEVKDNVKKVLKSQIQQGLAGLNEIEKEVQLCIAYEPIWAIGPGKTPPDAQYISFVGEYIKETMKNLYHRDVKVVYGGGLKKENAQMIASIPSINGGLVALTRFTGDIGFYSEELVEIIDTYGIKRRGEIK